MEDDEGDGLTFWQRVKITLPFTAASLLLLGACWAAVDGTIKIPWISHGDVFWVILVAQVPTFAPHLILWRIRRRRRERRRSGSCLRCGYCLAGNTSGVCPECGTPAPPPPR